MGVTKIVNRKGSGDTFAPGDFVTIKYVMYLWKAGRKSSLVHQSDELEEKQFKFQYGIGQLIRGLDKVLCEETVGSKFSSVISSDLGYGERGWPDHIPPHSDLYFEVEIIWIDKGPIPGHFSKRMPQDLLKYALREKAIDRIPTCEQNPADIPSETISLGLFEMKVYFPCTCDGKTIVFLHFPGGICKRSTNRDQSWCSNMAKDSGSIYISVDYRLANEVGFLQVLTDCRFAYECTRKMCAKTWKEQWGTDPSRVVLSGSSFGATLAINTAAISAQNKEPAFGLIMLVPLVNTDPSRTSDPWGENAGTIGLTQEQLLRDLSTAFESKHPDSREHWHSNPCKMPSEVMRLLPHSHIVIAKLDILYLSQVAFKNRLQAEGVKLHAIEVDGLHQVKDMDQETEAGRQVRDYGKQISSEFYRAR